MELIEFEHRVTGKTRKFPADLFHAITDCVLDGYPKAQQERVEEQVGKMVATFIDCNDRAYPIWEAAEAVCPEMKATRAPITLSKEAIALKLKAWADRTFARYGFPVWLIGDPVDELEVEIRIVLPDPDFEARFPGGAGVSLEAGKQGRLAALLLRMNVDFYILPDSACQHLTSLPRLRLDSNELPEGFEPPKSNSGT